MPVEYHIREMEREDLEQVAALEASCFSMPWKYKDFEDVLINPNRFYFVADARIENFSYTNILFCTQDKNVKTTVDTQEIAQPISVRQSTVKCISGSKMQLPLIGWTTKNTAPFIESKAQLLISNIIGGCMLTSIVGEGDISNVAVHEKYRKLNIATSLLETLMSFGRTHCDITAFTLEVRSKNAPAIRLYEKLGFITEGIRRNYYDKPKDDALIMWKRF